MSGSLQLPHTGSNGTGVEKEVIHSSLRVDTMDVKEFSLDDVWGPVHTTQKVTIPPFGTVKCTWHNTVMGHCMWVHVLAEQMPGPKLPTVVVPTVTYAELHLGSSQVLICLHNLSVHSIEIPTKMVVGQVMPANQVPLVVLLTGALEESISNCHKEWILEALAL